MKKVLAILIVLNMALALFACAGKPAESPSPSAPAETASGETTETPVSEAPRSALELGFYDPSIDYAAAGRYKIAYIYSGTSVVYDMLSTAFKAWADKMNVEFISFSAANADEFLTTAQTYCDEGYDGLVLDPDTATYPAALELVNRNNIPWMSGMTPAYNASAKLLHPSVAYDDYVLGFDMYQWCIDYAKATWTDATPENTGGMFVGYSGIGMPELRQNGAHDAWLKNGYSEESFFFLDGAIWPRLF
jgi:hypothetical protein